MESIGSKAEMAKTDRNGKDRNGRNADSEGRGAAGGEREVAVFRILLCM